MVYFTSELRILKLYPLKKWIQVEPYLHDKQFCHDRNGIMFYCHCKEIYTDLGQVRNTAKTHWLISQEKNKLMLKSMHNSINDCKEHMRGKQTGSDP